jgi:hypothetical protein
MVLGQGVDKNFSFKNVLKISLSNFSNLGNRREFTCMHTQLAKLLHVCPNLMPWPVIGVSLKPCHAISPECLCIQYFNQSSQDGKISPNRSKTKYKGNE